MSERNYRTYPEAFKLEAIRLLENSGKKASEIEQDLGITPGLLRKWRERYKIVAPPDQKATLEPSDLEAAKREIHRLERELREVAEEREILKKVISIFSRPQP
jgi:transposase